MPRDQQTLAQMIRAKYPGAYDDMDDVSLERAILANKLSLCRSLQPPLRC